MDKCPVWCFFKIFRPCSIWNETCFDPLGLSVHAWRSSDVPSDVLIGASCSGHFFAFCKRFTDGCRSSQWSFTSISDISYCWLEREPLVANVDLTSLVGVVAFRDGAALVFIGVALLVNEAVAIKSVCLPWPLFDGEVLNLFKTFRLFFNARIRGFCRCKARTKVIV